MFRTRVVIGLAGAVLVLAVTAAAAPAAPVEQGKVLISETSGVIWQYDIATDTLNELTRVEEPSNFDIQYTGPRSLVIANNRGFLSELDLTTLVETRVVEGFGESRGVAVSPRRGGTYYVADVEVCSIFEIHPGSTPILLTDEVCGIENVALTKAGDVYYSLSTEIGRIDPSADPITTEIVATFPEGAELLNGFVVTPQGTAYVAATAGPDRGVYEVDLSTGDVTPVWVGEPLLNPEDVALTPQGDLYVIDSAFLQPPESFFPGLYKIPAGGGSIEPLYVGDPFGDVVDLLLTPFKGF